jgi:hypothetical protein
VTRDYGTAAVWAACFLLVGAFWVGIGLLVAWVIQ